MNQRQNLMKLLVTLLLLLTTFNLQAEQATPAAKDMYDIELVLFEQADGYSYEKWPDDPGVPDRMLASVDLSSSLAGKSITFLNRDDLVLGPMAYTLRTKDAVVHAHLGLRIDVPARGTEQWYWIGKGALQGLIKITKGRYLHVDTDLLLSRPQDSHPYRIKMHRRMRSNELHYMDHPMAGIIVTAKRHEAETIIEEVPAESLPTEMFEDAKETVGAAKSTAIESATSATKPSSGE